MSDKNVNNWEVLYMGYDHGNAAIKFRGEKNRHYEIASYMLREYDNKTESLFAGINLSTFKILNDGEDSPTYVWGEDIEKVVENNQRRVIASIQEHNRYSEEEYRLLTGVSLAYTLPKNTNKAHLVVNTGLPSLEKGKKANPTVEEKDLIKVLENGGKAWRVEVDGKLKEFTVEVNEVIPQARGALFNYAYNFDGSDKLKQMLEILGDVKKDRRPKNILVLDIGGGTFCADGLFQLSINLKYSDFLGVSRAQEEIKNRLKKSLNATNESVGHRLKTGEREYIISEKNKDEKFGEIADEELRSLARQILKNLTDNNKEFKVINYDRILLVGGGALLLGEYIKEHSGWEDAIIMENAQTSNVDGYFKRLMNINAATTKGKE